MSLLESRSRARRCLFAGLLSLAPAASAHPLYLIGVDGASWNVMRPLMAQGLLPNMSRLAARGSSGPLRSITPMLSPRLWTTVATGVLPDQHGITDFMIGGRDLTSSDRRVPALWNILSASSRTVCVVGYMKTWPAEPVNGVMVSDYFYHRSLHRARRAYPPDVIPGLDALASWDEWSPESVRRLRRFIPFDYDPGYETLPHDSEVYKENQLVDLRLAWVYTRDESFTRAGEKLAALRRPDFFAIHLWGVDFVSHGFWKYMVSDSTDVAPSERRDFAAVIPRYYEYADELVGRLVAAAGEDADIMLVSDHGFQAWTPPPGDPNQILSGNHAIEGVLIAAGPDIRRGGNVEGAGLLDLAPTILFLTGGPIADTLKGRVLNGLLTDAAAKRPRRTVARYPPRAAQAGKPGTKIGAEALEFLKASGYIQ